MAINYLYKKIYIVNQLNIILYSFLNNYYKYEQSSEI